MPPTLELQLWYLLEEPLHYPCPTLTRDKMAEIKFQ